MYLFVMAVDGCYTAWYHQCISYIFDELLANMRLCRVLYYTRNVAMFLCTFLYLFVCIPSIAYDGVNLVPYGFRWHYQLVCVS